MRKAESISLPGRHIVQIHLLNASICLLCAALAVHAQSLTPIQDSLSDPLGDPVGQHLDQPDRPTLKTGNTPQAVDLSVRSFDGRIADRVSGNSLQDLGQRSLLRGTGQIRTASSIRSGSAAAASPSQTSRWTAGNAAFAAGGNQFTGTKRLSKEATNVTSVLSSNAAGAKRSTNTDGQSGVIPTLQSQTPNVVLQSHVAALTLQSPLQQVLLQSQMLAPSMSDAAPQEASIRNQGYVQQVMSDLTRPDLSYQPRNHPGLGQDSQVDSKSAFITFDNSSNVSADGPLVNSITTNRLSLLTKGWTAVSPASLRMTIQVTQTGAGTQMGFSAGSSDDNRLTDVSSQGPTWGDGSRNWQPLSSGPQTMALNPAVSLLEHADPSMHLLEKQTAKYDLSKKYESSK